MDKQKQLNEMHQILLSAGYDWWKTTPNGKTKSEYEAECFYNAGYRKIPETVVLTREEREEFNELYRSALQRAEKWEKLCGIKIKETRKETAEKFAERLRKVFEKDDDWDECSVGTVRDYIDEICEEISEGK